MLQEAAISTWTTLKESRGYRFKCHSSNILYFLRSLQQYIYSGKKGIWLGYHKNTTTLGKHWTWTDNLKTAYENWGSDTKRAAIVGNCSQQISTESDWPTWQQADCETKQHFVCKMHAMWNTFVVTIILYLQLGYRIDKLQRMTTEGSMQPKP